MELAQNVYHYYLNNSHLLTEDKLFHFGTRTAAWLGAPESFDILKSSYNFIVQPDRDLFSLVAEIVNSEQTGKRNAHELRQPYFEKYPQLYGAHLALFRVRHLEAVYGIDARAALFAAISEAELVQLRDELLADDDALRVLSTFGINYCYLLERVVRKDNSSLPLQHFYDIGAAYDTENIQHLQLLIYLYTHCIIGESNFYTQTIARDKLPIYRQMLTSLESLIEKNFEKINLDNKLEFLVCARICNFTSTLSDRIYAECEQSISPDGTFVIDMHNENVQNDRNDFVRSEHRNVLFIMSTSAYTPHSTLVM